MYANSTAPVDTIPSRAPCAVIGSFREQYAGHFCDAARRLAPELAVVRDPSGLNPFGEWLTEARAFLRLHATETAARNAVWGR